MTNFEKWKSELTPEKLLHEGYHSGNQYKAAIFICSYCPVDTCIRKNPRCVDPSAVCESSLLQWATMEAE